MPHYDAANFVTVIDKYNNTIVTNGLRWPGFGSHWNRSWGSGPGQEPTWTPTWVTRARLLIGPDIIPCYFRRVVPWTLWHIADHASLSPMRYINCDWIKTWSIHLSCRIDCSFTFRFEFGELTSICWAAFNNSSVSAEISRLMIVTAGIVIGWQIWTREAMETQTMHTIWIPHVLIQSELRISTVGKVIRLKWWVLGDESRQIAILPVVVG